MTLCAAAAASVRLLSPPALFVLAFCAVNAVGEGASCGATLCHL